MAYNKAREEKKWRLWKEAEEKQLRSLGVSENDIEKLRVHDWAIFNSDRRYYQRMQETGTYLEEVAADMTQPEINTVEDFLDNIENQQLYQVLIKVDMSVVNEGDRQGRAYISITTDNEDIQFWLTKDCETNAQIGDKVIIESAIEEQTNLLVATSITVE